MAFRLSTLQHRIATTILAPRTHSGSIHTHQSSFHRGAEPTKANRHQPTSPNFTTQSQQHRQLTAKPPMNHPCEARAGDGNRTHVASLEGWNSTIELHPRTELERHLQWREQDSNLRRHCHQIYSLAPLATRVSRLTHTKNEDPLANFPRPTTTQTINQQELAVGLEPTTAGLQNRNSTVELR